MPYIDLKTTKNLNSEKCEALKTAFGKAIEVFPGKSEAWLMVGIEGSAKLWFKGDASDDSAIVCVDLLGEVNPSASEKMTAVICDILKNEIGVAPERVYVKYTGFSNWGWNGQNF